MSAVLRPDPGPVHRPMRVADLDAVLAVEAVAYAHPWTRGNFIDSLVAGYLAEMLVHDTLGLVGYYVAMPGVDEMHLLNLTVAPAQQRRGHSRTLLDALERLAHLGPSHPVDGLEVRLGLEVLGIHQDKELDLQS